MSTNLYYKPITPDNDKSLSHELKGIFNDKYNLSDKGHILTESDLPYLEGLRDGMNDAKIKNQLATLIALIEKHPHGVKIYLS